ncbi:MAG: hypothetical protein ACOYK8_04725 [Alphaproteobacteria bacterium]
MKNLSDAELEKILLERKKFTPSEDFLSRIIACSYHHQQMEKTRFSLQSMGFLREFNIPYLMPTMASLMIIGFLIGFSGIVGISQKQQISPLPTMIYDNGGLL